MKEVLNLIINGIPSILPPTVLSKAEDMEGFKPYYKWNTFNTNILKMTLTENFAF